MKIVDEGGDRTAFHMTGSLIKSMYSSPSLTLADFAPCGIGRISSGLLKL